jgi:glycosyltransferase involved in cell wall biosynthesis
MGLQRGVSSNVKILLSADPFIPVPPTGYGGIERIIDSLARAFRNKGHAVGLVAHPDSKCDVDCLYKWDAKGNIGDALDLRKFTRDFCPDVLQSFSRLAYLVPQLASRLPKVMSYQRHTGGRQIQIASMLGGRSLTFTGCSEYIASMGRRSGGDWRAIHNFVELSKIDFRPTVAADAPLLFLSRIESIKGPDLAIEIARRSGRKLILAGNRPTAGSELDFWSQRVAPAVDSGEVDWVGEVDDVRKNELLGQAAALIVPIQWGEPFGIVFAEALAAGTPVITCQRGATPEIVDPGITGFFVTDAASGAQAVSRLGAIDRRACRKAAEERFSSKACADLYLALYQEKIGR